MTVFCCSASAQLSYTNSLAGATLIYSNAFSGGAVDINGTAPTYINPNAASYGGSLSAAFDVLSNNVANGYYAYQNGTFGAKLDSVLLPFTPVPGYVYTLSFNLTYRTTPPAGGYGGFGFAIHFPVSNSAIADPRIGGTPGGNPWTLLNLGTSGGGAVLEAAGASQGNVASLMTTLNVPYTINLILDTTGAKWIVYEYINGLFVKNYTYPTTNPALLSLGYTQTTTTAGAFQWGPMELFASPMVITINPASASVAAGAAFTNTIAVAATNTSYQWYYNTTSNYAGGIALTNDGRILGSTTNSLIFTDVLSTDAGYYFVAVTNALGGSLTSSIASLTVYSTPTVALAYPVSYTNPFTLFAGTNVAGTDYPGASPAFSVSVVGQAPLYYQWLTNGVAVGGATNTSFTFTNCQLTSPTSFACVVTNVGGAATNTWLTTYVQEPGALFADTVMSYNPAGFWRLNEGGDDGNGDDGAIATDYVGGNNGLYTNAIFGYATYTNTDSTAASVRFNYAGTPSDVFAVQGIDYSNKVNATFTVQGWVNGVTAQPSGAPIIAKGYNGGEQFALDITGNKFRFLVRNAAGTASSVTAPTGLDNNWHFIVGVCDEVNGAVTLYVDGLQAAASASITPGSGMFANTTPVTFGARGSTATVYDDLQFSGYLSDVAVYNSALSPIQVANLYSAAGFPVSFTFVPPLPPTNYVFLANTTITIPATVFCPQGNNGYYWTNLTTGGSVIASGIVNTPGNLNATLTIPAASPTLSGDLLELVVTNANNSTNWFVTLFSPAPPIALDYSSPILYSNYFDGGALSIGGVPLTAANLLVGGTNAMWNLVSNNPAAGYAAYGNGTLGASLNSVLLPFTPHSGYVYTLEASLTFTVTPPAGGWGGLGFSTQFPTNYVTDPRVLNQGWALLNLDANGGGALLNANGASQGGTPNLMTALNTPYDIQVVLDTTSAQWSVALYVAGTFVTNYIYAAGNPSIASFGYTQTTTTAGAFQWNSIALTQVASNAPPYLLASLPASVTLNANSSLSIPASAFSSFAPYGYYWANTNTAALLQSGTTNNVAPLISGLSYPSVPGSWNGNTLALVLTNAYGTNISLVLLTVTNSTIIPLNQPVIASFSLVGGNVVINATNGQSGGTYYLLGTTNLITPLSQWLPLSTNVILTNSAANGFTFTGTNVVNTGVPQQFYILSNTN
jgi:hypothetical protein